MWRLYPRARFCLSTLLGRRSACPLVGLLPTCMPLMRTKNVLSQPALGTRLFFLSKRLDSKTEESQDKVSAIGSDEEAQANAEESSTSETSGELASTEEEDANYVFESVWSYLSEKFGENLMMPKDIMWLSGAPGSGKGIFTSFVKEIRGITSDVIVISDLLRGPNIEAIKSKGQLASNRMVVQLLFEELLKPEYASGVIVDGFPRTRVQGECMKHLFDAMLQLGNSSSSDVDARFRRPVFHIMVLFVEEDVSVERQLKRGRETAAKNRRTKSTGIGELVDTRPTDLDPKLARQRYLQFKEHVFDSLQAVKRKFHFHLIDASGSVQEVKSRIQRELQYQSDLELSNDAFEMVRRIPLPEELTKNARHYLVKRLDEYTQRDRQLFSKVILVLENEFIAIFRRQAVLGRCIIRTENPVLHDSVALDMLLDLLTERGYNTVVDVQRVFTPISVKEGKIISKLSKVFEFHISFPRPIVRFGK